MTDLPAFKKINPLWHLAETLTVRQAAALIAGFDPGSVDESGNSFRNSESGEKDCDGIGWVQTALSALTNAINSGVLPATVRRVAWQRGWDEEPEPGARLTHDVAVVEHDVDDAAPDIGTSVRRRGVIYRVEPDWSLSTTAVDDLRTWLARRNVHDGFFFSPTSNTPDYFDRDSPRYAPKLAAALSAWLAVQEPGRKSPKQALEKWLREHAAEFGLTDEAGNPVRKAVEECARVANWEPGGGAPRSD